MLRLLLRRLVVRALLAVDLLLDQLSLVPVVGPSPDDSNVSDAICEPLDRKLRLLSPLPILRRLAGVSRCLLLVGLAPRVVPHLSVVRRLVLRLPIPRWYRLPLVLVEEVEEAVDLVSTPCLALRNPSEDPVLLPLSCRQYPFAILASDLDCLVFSHLWGAFLSSLWHVFPRRCGNDTHPLSGCAWDLSPVEEVLSRMLGMTRL